MTTQHKALELADWLDNCEPNFYGESSLRMDSKLSDAVCDLTDIARTQHALIVQMRKALNTLDGLRGPFPPSDEEIGAAWDKAGKSIAAADKYLGEK